MTMPLPFCLLLRVFFNNNRRNIDSISTVAASLNSSSRILFSTLSTVIIFYRNFKVSTQMPLLSSRSSC